MSTKTKVLGKSCASAAIKDVVTRKVVMDDQRPRQNRKGEDGGGGGRGDGGVVLRLVFYHVVSRYL